MKTKTKVLEISKEELSDLFCCATEGSNYFQMSFKKSDYYGTELEDEYDYTCDKAAKLLLAGKTAIVRDYYADDENDHYGRLPHKYDEKRECMTYTITLDDIKRGVENIMDGDEKYLKECLADWVTDSACNLDLTEAESIMQVIIFGELVYG